MKRWIVLFILLLGSVPAVAQPVQLEAVVTDLEGNRVSGLAAGDFRLLVDGVEVPVEQVTEVADGTVGRSYLVFIDETLCLAVQRDLVLWEIERDLDRLDPEDRMAVVVFDGVRLHRLADWTADREILTSAFAEARKRPAGKGVSSSAMDDAAEALRSFLPPPGRRTMLVLSGGWPAEPSLELVRDANRLGYTLYPVDVPALGREQVPEDMLQALADATGGRAALNANRLAALERAEEDTRAYYLLSFSPSSQGDHRIELEVRRPGLDVRAREGVSDPSATLAGSATESTEQTTGE